VTGCPRRRKESQSHAKKKKKESHSVKSARRRHFADAKFLGENGAKNCQVPKGLEMIEK
jgi:hypothetical protein